MPPRSDLRSAHVWRGTLVAALLNAVGTPLDLVVGRSIPGLPWWPAASSSLVGFAVVAILLFRGSAVSRRLGSILFLVNNMAIVMAMWMSAGYFAASPGHWAPFQANKLGAMAVALLAPEAWVGATSIVFMVGSALIRIQTFDEAVRGRLPHGEPWVLVVFGIFGLVLLGYRLRGLSMEREAMKAHVASEAAATTARAFLAVRDLANTPLQTIELNNALLRTKNPELFPLLDRIQRSLEKLRGLNRMLQEYESKLEWKPGDESFDAAARLRAVDKQPRPR